MFFWQNSRDSRSQFLNVFTRQKWKICNLTASSPTHFFYCTYWSKKFKIWDSLVQDTMTKPNEPQYLVPVTKPQISPLIHSSDKVVPFPVQSKILSGISRHCNPIVQAEVDLQDAYVTQSGNSKLKRMQSWLGVWYLEMSRTSWHHKVSLPRKSAEWRKEPVSLIILQSWSHHPRIAPPLNFLLCEIAPNCLRLLSRLTCFVFTCSWSHPNWPN